MSFDDFRNDVIQEVKEGVNAPIQIADRMGLPVKFIYEWMDEEGIDTVTPKKEAVIELVKQSPEKIKEIADAEGFNEETVKKWVKELRQYKKSNSTIKNEVLQDISKGMTLSEANKLYGFPLSTLYRWVKKSGTDYKSNYDAENGSYFKKMNKGLRDDVIADFKSGISRKDIIKKYAISAGSLHTWLKNAASTNNTVKINGSEEMKMKSQADQVRELLSNGKGAPEICGMTGVRKEYVWNIKSQMKKDGLQVPPERSPGRNKKISEKVMKSALNEYFASGKSVSDRMQIAEKNGMSSVSLYRRIRIDKRYKKYYSPRVSKPKPENPTVTQVTSVPNTLEHELHLARLEAENAVLRKYLNNIQAL